MAQERVRFSKLNIPGDPTVDSKSLLPDDPTKAKTETNEEAIAGGGRPAVEPPAENLSLNNGIYKGSHFLNLVVYDQYANPSGVIKKGQTSPYPEGWEYLGASETFVKVDISANLKADESVKPPATGDIQQQYSNLNWK